MIFYVSEKEKKVKCSCSDNIRLRLSEYCRILSPRLRLRDSSTIFTSPSANNC